MNTANLTYGKLITMKFKDTYKYNFYYTAESPYLCCIVKNYINCA